MENNLLYSMRARNAIKNTEMPELIGQELTSMKTRVETANEAFEKALARLK